MVNKKHQRGGTFKGGKRQRGKTQKGGGKIFFFKSEVMRDFIKTKNLIKKKLITAKNNIFKTNKNQSGGFYRREYLNKNNPNFYYVQ